MSATCRQVSQCSVHGKGSHIFFSLPSCSEQLKGTLWVPVALYAVANCISVSAESCLPVSHPKI
jgi:hypothetical protein